MKNLSKIVRLFGERIRPFLRGMSRTFDIYPTGGYRVKYSLKNSWQRDLDAMEREGQVVMNNLQEVFSGYKKEHPEVVKEVRRRS